MSAWIGRRAGARSRRAGRPPPPGRTPRGGSGSTRCSRAACRSAGSSSVRRPRGPTPTSASPAGRTAGCSAPRRARSGRRRCSAPAPPVDGAHLTGGLVGDRVRRLAAGGVHAAVAAGAVERRPRRSARTARRPIRRTSPPGRPRRRAWRAGSKIQYSGRPITDHDEQQHAEQLDALEAAALQRLVVEVRLAVGGQLDLRADLLARRSGVEEGVDEEADDDDRASMSQAMRRGRQGDASMLTSAGDAVRALGLLAGRVGADRRPGDDRRRCRR